MGGDRRAAGRQFVEDRGFQVAEHCHGHGSRDGGGGHDQQVRRFAGLGPERVTLFDAEAVLVRPPRSGRGRRRDVFAEQRVGADHDPGGAGRGASSMACFRAAVGIEPVSSVTCTESGPRPPSSPSRESGAEGAADGVEVLRREHLGGGQQRRLSPGRRPPAASRAGHNRFARADLACSSRFIGESSASSSARVLPTAACPAVRVKGSCRSKAASRPPANGGAGGRPPRQPIGRGAGPGRTAAPGPPGSGSGPGPRCQSAGVLGTWISRLGSRDRQELSPGRRCPPPDGSGSASRSAVSSSVRSPSGWTSWSAWRWPDRTGWEWPRAFPDPCRGHPGPHPATGIRGW